jgi:hypothetical protein
MAFTLAPGASAPDFSVPGVDDLLAGEEVPEPVTNPIGCNVKWKGKAEHRMPPGACDLV